MKKANSIIFIFLGLILPITIACADPATETKGEQSKVSKYFAVINGETIALSEFLYAYSKAVKEKFFHGKVSQEQLDTFKKEVAEKLVLEILLSNEARKRGLQPNKDKVQQEVDKVDAQYSNAPSEKEKEDWAKYKDEALPIVRKRAEREELVQLLKKEIENIKQPPVEKVKAYYEANKDKFTAPQRWDVSIILLPVDPSSSSDEWGETVEKAEQLLKKIHKGESFEELARIHSGDESAVNGGDMGYMHIGMFGEPAQKVLNIMEPGEISEPVVLLEGVAIFRLNDVEKAALNSFEEVQERAENLLARELSERAWEEFKLSIRKAATVNYGDLFAPTSEEAGENKSG